jgi:FAD/FMN-containing dehydrogenase
MIRKRAVALALLAVAGCSSSTPGVDREKKLLSMASAEAQFIPDPKDRLSRQLNFANDQTAGHQTAEARESLAHAVETLKTPEAMKMDWQIRIAGWVSVSQLSRGLKDTAVAESACDQAVALLRQIDPVAERPRYVIGVANEVRELHGPEASAKLLEESAPWTAEIKDQPTRRGALFLIADSIFACDDYKGGLVALRTDPDAAWRSDSLKQLADDQGPIDWISNVGNGAVPGSVAASPSDESRFTPTPEYQKPVDFQSVFQRQK